MNRAKVDLKHSLRVVWAIAAKDIVDAIKSKTTLFTILLVFFAMAAYRVLPSFENAGLLPRLAIFDAGESRLVAELENHADFDVYLARSRTEMEAYLGHRDLVALGLVLPPDFDQRLASDEMLELQGYVVHWADASAAAEVQAFIEAKLTELAGKPVPIDIDSDTVYTQKDSRGYALLAALSVILAITLIGLSLVPHIMLEERAAKTLDALLVSPASVGQVVAGKALTGLFYCLTATAVAFALNLTLVNYWVLAVVAAILGSLFTVALGLLVGSIIENRGQLSLWAWLLFIPLLSPPLLVALNDILPAGLITALRLVPTVALSRVLRVSFSGSAPLADFGPELAFLVAWCLPVFLAVAWVIRRSDR